MPRLDRTVGMRNKVETRLKKCKKGGKTAIFLLVDSENFSSTSSVEKMAKDLLNATKNMKNLFPVILVGGSSATDQMGMDKAVRVLRVHQTAKQNCMCFWDDSCNVSRK